MHYLNTNSDYFGWDWLLWMVFIFLVFSSIGTWGYSYRAHRKFDGSARGDAAAILNQRYAAGELTRAEYLDLKSDIAAA